ncbi:MAG: 4Fe-4S binding protein [Candidatus Lokiarchaeota archaeon]|nr:4Fe-4S binding protein [Candidatus Lokiarchaeota archaeon]
MYFRQIGKTRVAETSMTYAIDTYACVGCGNCASICPDGIEIIDGKAHIVNQDAACLEIAAMECPRQSIYIEGSPRVQNTQSPYPGMVYGRGMGRGMGGGMGMGRGYGRGLGMGPRDGRGGGRGGGGPMGMGRGMGAGTGKGLARGPRDGRGGGKGGQ